MQANAAKVVDIWSFIRWVFVAMSATVALVVALRVLGHALTGLASALHAPFPEPAVVAVAEAVAASGACWLAVGTLYVLLAEPPWCRARVTQRIARRCIPRCWRAAVLAAAGSGMLAGPALVSAAATAVPAPTDQGPHQPRAAALAVLDGLALPDRASGGWHRQPTVVVTRGDCLWSLAAASLPRTATDAAVARHTDRLYKENATVIGADPDLLLPGIRLHAPVPGA